MWAEAPPEVKAQFTEAAKREKEEHSRLYVSSLALNPFRSSTDWRDISVGIPITATSLLIVVRISSA